MDGWQHKAAFVIQLRPETDVELRRFEGRIEHSIVQGNSVSITRSAACFHRASAG
jgi:hypothetical protein